MQEIVRHSEQSEKGVTNLITEKQQQEPRLLAHICNEQNLKETYNQGRDLYATIGSMIWGLDYWECMEHWEDGSSNKEGEKRRKKCKSIVLGKTYDCPYVQ